MNKWETQIVTEATSNVQDIYTYFVTQPDLATSFEEWKKPIVNNIIFSLFH